jgi:hypothetical protein
VFRPIQLAYTPVAVACEGVYVRASVRMCVRALACTGLCMILMHDVRDLSAV